MRFSPFKRAGAAVLMAGGLACAAALAQAPATAAHKASASNSAAHKAGAATAVEPKRLDFPGVGRTPTPEEIAAWDHAIGPSGKGLPPGQGTAAQGAPIYQSRCSMCHGSKLQGVRRVAGDGSLFGGPALAGGRGQPLWGTGPMPPLTIGSYRPFATTVFDVIYRAMPAYQGGTLTPDEVYALTAFLLYKNDIIKEDTVLNASTLPEIVMPNRHGFVPDKLEDIPNFKKRGCYKTYGTCP
jgi:mono/diheme cytochrome c family protein